MNCESSLFKNVIIVGGAGFIGSELAMRLVALPDVCQVTVYDVRPPNGRLKNFISRNTGALRVVTADVRDGEILLKTMKDASLVIHLAANASTANGFHSPRIDVDDGLLLTAAVLECMRELKLHKLVFASSSAVYGDHGDALLVEHQTELHPKSIYGATKLGGEALIGAYQELFGIDSLILRFGNPIGIGMSRGFLFDMARRYRDQGSSFHVKGNGHQARTYLRVESAIDLMLELIKKTLVLGKSDTINLSGRGIVSVRDVIALASKLLGVPFDPRYEEDASGWPGDVPTVHLSLEKLESVYGIKVPQSRQEIWDVLGDFFCCADKFNEAETVTSGV